MASTRIDDVCGEEYTMQWQGRSVLIDVFNVPYEPPTSVFSFQVIASSRKVASRLHKAQA